MATKNDEQIQIRIDSKTKNKVKKTLDGLGMDMILPIKIFFRQVINAKNFPGDLRDENGLTLQNAAVLRQSIVDAKNSSKFFAKGANIIKAALKD